MNNAIKNAVIFATGAAIGSVVTWKLLKTKFEQFAQAEIDSVKEVYSNRASKLINDADEESHDEVPERREKRNTLAESYKRTVNDLGYTNYADIGKKEKVAEKHDVSNPYVISPEDFGEYDAYDRISLVYYADEVLAEKDEIVEDIEGTVGFDALNHFGEFEEDSVHVRNDRLKIDYEILRVEERYSDSITNPPRRTEV